MTKLIINIDSSQGIGQLNEDIQVSADPQTAVNKIIRYLRGALIGSNNGITVQVTTRDTDPAASTAAMVKAKVDATVAAAALVDVAVSGTSTKGQTAQAKTNLAGGADAIKALKLTQGITFTAKTGGVAGNAYDFTVIDSGAGLGTLSYTEVGGDIILDLNGLTPTRAQVVTYMTTTVPSAIVDAVVTTAGNVIVAAKVDFAGGVDAVKASKIIQDLTYTADAAGAAGNSITVTYADTANLGAETCGVVSNDITVGIQTTVKALGTSSVQNTHVV